MTSPLLDSASSPTVSPSDSWIVIESDEDPLPAARNATSRVLDLLMQALGLTDLHAYILCSVPMQHQLSQVVTNP